MIFGLGNGTTPAVSAAPAPVLSASEQAALNAIDAIAADTAGTCTAQCTLTTPSSTPVTGTSCYTTCVSGMQAAIANALATCQSEGSGQPNACALASIQAAMAAGTVATSGTASAPCTVSILTSLGICDYWIYAGAAAIALMLFMRGRH